MNVACTTACQLGHTHLPGCVHGAFFQPGRVYVNRGAFAGRQQVHRFRCVAVEPHPNDGAITALGWLEIMPGIWAPGGIPARDYVPDHWNET